MRTNDDISFNYEKRTANKSIIIIFIIRKIDYPSLEKYLIRPESQIVARFTPGEIPSQTCN